MRARVLPRKYVVGRGGRARAVAAGAAADRGVDCRVVRRVAEPFEDQHGVEARERRLRSREREGAEGSRPIAAACVEAARPDQLSQEVPVLGRTQRAVGIARATLAASIELASIGRSGKAGSLTEVNHPPWLTKDPIAPPRGVLRIATVHVIPTSIQNLCWATLRT